MPSITTTFSPFNLIKIGTSPPNEKCENSITEAARIVATPASTELPPCSSIRRPASTDKGEPPATTPRFPRTTGRNVSACEVDEGKAAMMKAIIRQKPNSFRLRLDMGGHLFRNWLLVRPWTERCDAPLSSVLVGFTCGIHL